VAVAGLRAGGKESCQEKDMIQRPSRFYCYEARLISANQMRNLQRRVSVLESWMEELVNRLGNNKVMT